MKVKVSSFFFALVLGISIFTSNTSLASDYSCSQIPGHIKEAVKKTGYVLGSRKPISKPVGISIQEWNKHLSAIKTCKNK